MTRLLVVFTLILLTGCGVQPRVTLDPDQRISSRDARWMLRQDAPQADIILLDATYCTPSAEWVEWVGAAYRRHQRAIRLLAWLPFFDCNRRSRSFQSYVAAKYAQQAHEGWPQGAAVFCRSYQRDERDPEYNGWHMINTMTLPGGSVADWEPMDGWVELMPSERQSTEYIGD